MSKTRVAASALAGLVIAAGAASAGPCRTEIESLQEQLSSTNADMGSTGGGAVVAPGNQATQGKVASSEDVVTQNEGEPAESGTAQAGKLDGSLTSSAVEDSLKRARQFDQTGDESACVNEIRNARRLLSGQ